MLTHDFLNCAQLLSKKIHNLEILVPLNHQTLVDNFMKLSTGFKIKLKVLYTQQSWEVMIASDVALLASGTATLECMLAKCPMVVAYRVNPLTFILIKKFIKTPWISLPNLLSESNLVAEFIQKDCNPYNLTQALLCLLNYDIIQLHKLQQKFYKLHQTIKLNANKKITDAILQCLQS